MHSRKIIEDLHSAGIDKIDMGAIQIQGFLLSKERPTFSVEENGPLCGDLALQLEEHLAPTFLNLRNLEHHLFLSYVFV